MPLHDHFHSPVQELVSWRSIFSGWATRLADSLNDQWLPKEYVAAEFVCVGLKNEIDSSTPPEAPRTMPAVFPDTFEVRVFSTDMGGNHLVAAIGLVSPTNKERQVERRAFAIQYASYLCQGVSVVLIDVVTSHRANLHNEIMHVLEKTDEWYLPVVVDLYCVAYRPVRRQSRAEIDLWTLPCSLGQPLPAMPLRLRDDTFVPVEFESTYQETCRRRGLV
jgi:hypothetical protein